MKPPELAGWGAPIYVAVKSGCQFNCIYCYSMGGDLHDRYLKEQEKAGIPLLTLNEEDKIISWAKKYFQVGIICGEGEPTIHPEFYDAMELFIEHGLNPAVTTNAYHMSDKLLRFLNDNSVITLGGKLHSFDREKNNYLIGAKGRFEPHYIEIDIGNGKKGYIMEGLHKLIHETDLSKKNKLAIQSEITALNDEDTLEIYRWCREEGLIPYPQLLYFCGKALEHIDELSWGNPTTTEGLKREFQKRREISDRIFEIDREFGFEYEKPVGSKPGFVAVDADDLFVVLYNGEVTTCVASPFSMGNVRDKNGEITAEHLDELLSLQRELKPGCMADKESKSPVYEAFDVDLSPEEMIYFCHCDKMRRLMSKDSFEIFDDLVNRLKIRE